MATDWTSVPDFGLSWLDASGPHADIVLSTRVRLARNLQGHAFAARARSRDRESVFSAVEQAVARTSILPDGALLRMETLDVRDCHILLERRLISPDLLGRGIEEPVQGAAAVISPRMPVSMMVNEEDHLRLQSLASGLHFTKAWDLADRLHEEVGEHLPIAFHHEFGYLTSCPTNAGTGLRASALVHMPGLVLTKEIEKVLRGIGQVGLTFRGLHGEGSGVMGNFFQISNQTTLGRSEEDLLEQIHRTVVTVIEKEQEARHVLLRDAASVAEDKIWRAYGILRYCRTLAYEELMNLLSGVRLGVAMGLVPDLTMYTLNKIMIFSQAAHLDQAAGRDLLEAERRLQRAEYVRAMLGEGAGGPGEVGGGPTDIDPTSGPGNGEAGTSRPKG